MKKAFLLVAISMMSFIASAQDSTNPGGSTEPSTQTVFSDGVVKMSHNPSVKKVNSLLGNIAFDQGKPYNQLCPMIGDKHCITGCTITALAQVMKYYRYPQRPTIPAGESGQIEYDTKKQVHVSWDLTKTTFDWNNILDTYKNVDATDSQKKAVATLMAAVGAAAHANYGLDGTSADTRRNYMIDYFGYDKDGYRIHGYSCSLGRKCLEIKNAIDAGQIVCVASLEGHYFLIDGYDMTGEHPRFHVNWGWSDRENGFFDLKDLKPSLEGGSDDTNYSGLYIMYMNTIPENNMDDGLALMAAAVLVDKKTVSPGDQIKVAALKIANESKIRAVNDMEYFYLIDINSNKCYKTDGSAMINDLEPCKYDIREGPFVNTITKTITIPSTVPPGKYHIELRRSNKDHFFTRNPATIVVN